jgi:hypothetical protein
MSGLFGPSNRQTSTAFNFSALSNYYAAKTQPHTAAPARPTGTPAVSVAPWSHKVAAPVSVSRLSDALTATSFVDTGDSAFNKSGVEQDHKKLFALYKGLSRLEALAARASQTSTPAAELTGLNRRIQSGLAEIKTFLSDKAFDELTLLMGARTSTADSALKIARPPTKYMGPSIVGGSSSNVIPGLTGSEIFTASVVKAGATIDVTMDLSAAAGDLSVDNVVSYMNSQMEAAGVTTRFSRSIFDGKATSDPKRYGIAVQTVASERMSLSAASTVPAVYAASVAGSGATQNGQLIKLSDEGTGVASNFNAKITPASGVTDVKATAVDVNGNVFVVGSTTGDLGSGLVQGDQDVYLRKYDSAGGLVWSRLLGASASATGLALATDGNGNVAIAGKVTGRLTTTAIGGGDDTFVTKYDSQGRELFTRQIAPALNDQANALAFGTDGSLYVAGQTKSALSASVTHGGGSDAYLMKLTPSGSLNWARQFGGSGDDRASALAIDGNGDVILGTVEAGEAKVRKLLSSDGTSAAVWEMSLGAIGEGQVSSLAVSDGAVYVAGTTDNADLTAGGTAAIVSAHGGGSDGFVMKISDAGPTAGATYISYVGSAGNDSTTGVVASNGFVYVSGSTNGSLSGGDAPSQTNGYIAKLDSDGARLWTHQYEGTQRGASTRALAVDSQGGSVLDKLGLPRGAIKFDETRLITAGSSVRAGDYFTVKINNNATYKITVKANDTMRSLVTRINSAMILKGEATQVRAGGDGIRIAAKDGNVIELIRGSAGFDALAGLGLEPGKLDHTKGKASASAKPKDINVFALGLDANASIGDTSSAQTLSRQLASALEAIKSAYKAVSAK